MTIREGRRFSIFRSAGDEEKTRASSQARRDGEGGHMSCTSGRIVSTPGAKEPFKAVMTGGDGRTFEIAFATMAEAEVFVRRNTPKPATRSTTYDHDPD